MIPNIKPKQPRSYFKATEMLFPDWPSLSPDLKPTDRMSHFFKEPDWEQNNPQISKKWK